MISWYALVILSAVFMGLASIVRKHILKKEHAMEILSTEGTFRFIFILLLVPFVRFPAGAEWIIIFVAVAAGLATDFYRYRSYRHLPISVVAPMHNISPLFLLIIAITLLGETLATKQLIGIGMIMIGGYALQLKGKDVLSPIKHWIKNKYAMTLLFTLIFLSLLGALDKVGLQDMGIPLMTWLFWSILLRSLIGISMQLKMHGIAEWKTDMKRDWKWLSVAAFLGVGNLLIYMAALTLPGVLVSLAIPLRRTATLIETMLGGALFHEDHLLQKGLATIVMLAGILFIV